MLPEARQVDELEVDDLDAQVFGLRQHFPGVSLGVGNSRPGRNGHTATSLLSGSCYPNLRHRAGPTAAPVALLLRRVRLTRRPACPARRFSMVADAGIPGTIALRSGLRIVHFAQWRTSRG